MLKLLQTILEPSIRHGLIDHATAARIRHDVQANRADPVRAISMPFRYATKPSS